ncbi:MAG: Twitching motility protein PilT [Ignavibacteria bacterium]|nr:MAG: Twitching motility protein PilT [Ignavibacteria bacterium]KAF0160605.1 MAG: Twitching motility protein PilT [Ignavibacteria bacterium]
MISEAKQILTAFASLVPSTVLGAERVRYIAEHIQELQIDHKLMLLNLLNNILAAMIDRQASDVEIGGFGAQNSVWFRIFGKKERVLDLPQFSEDEASTLIISILNKNQIAALLENRNLDFSYTFKYDKIQKQLRFRCDAYFDLDSITMNMRAIQASIRPLESLDFHPFAVKIMSHNYIKFGLSLVTGITGSGKSTTLDAIIDFHNDFDQSHIVIIASPIEFVHRSKKAIIKHREVGKDVPSFKDGVIQSLRQDPDIIVIGEMRDPETILAALEVTDTGHKVFSTLHTSSAVESIDRIIAEVHPNEQERVRNRLADVLISVVSQKLVPSLDGKRVLAKEVLIVTPSVRAAIKNNNTSEIYMMINQGGPQGMVTMEQDLLRLFTERKISKENAISYANNKTRILQLMKGN